ncbi:hypothetical protein ACFY9A_08525 [Streptomyces rubradiris]|uniref:hypothetical protein n=1 Tax=Streptomyces rubradiris TaxID=285531 RepID=UPI0036E2CB6B
MICGTYFLLPGAFVVAVLLRSPSGFRLDVFAPSGLTGAAFGLSIVFALASSETTDAYGEETRDPHRTVPRATYLALFLLTGLFIAGTWAVVAGMNGAPQAIAQAGPGERVPELFGFHLGSWTSTPLKFVIESNPAWANRMSLLLAICAAYGALRHQHLHRRHRTGQEVPEPAT